MGKRRSLDTGNERERAGLLDCYKDFHLLFLCITIKALRVSTFLLLYANKVCCVAIVVVVVAKATTNAKIIFTRISFKEEEQIEENTRKTDLLMDCHSLESVLGTICFKDELHSSVEKQKVLVPKIKYSNLKIFLKNCEILASFNFSIYTTIVVGVSESTKQTQINDFNCFVNSLLVKCDTRFT